MTGQPSGLGDRIRLWRHKRQMTQEQLAYAAEVSVSVVQKVERGERRSVRLDTARRLAEALGVATSDLLGDQDVAVDAQQRDAARDLAAVERAQLALRAHRAAADTLRAVEHEVWRLYQAGRYDLLAAVLRELRRL
jgi:transcriptional regulator with XRE-family HTH domain